MRLFRRRDNRRPEADPAIVDAPARDEPARSVDELRAEIERLSGGPRDRETERRLLRLRHRLGAQLMREQRAAPSFAEPDAAALPEAVVLPEVRPADLTPGLLRAAILRHGCLLVRGLVDRDEALRFAGEIDRAFSERERHNDADGLTDGYYEEFEPDEPFGGVVGREWIQRGGGVLAADSPRLAYEMIELFRRAGLPALVEGYLGEPPLISVHKTTLRKADPAVSGAWHQDGNFMGPVRSLNLWLSLSRCGDEAPGLDIIPRRLEELVAAGTPGTFVDIQVSQENAELAAGDTPILRPIFEPGDALLFDELFLHQTASDPSMPNPRFAIENWFFGSSAFPEDYAPIAV